MAIGRSNSWRVICIVIIVSFISMASLSHQSNTILPGQSIYYNQSIISQGGIFELRFFSLFNSGKFHVGIFYTSIRSALAWTANKDTPILSSDINDANLILTKEGDLQLQVNGKIIWNTSTTTNDLNTTKAILLDSGNLVVGSDSSPHMWESFNYPTDAWLPGAKIGLDTTTGRTDPIILTAWVSPYDFGSGIYSFGMDSGGSNELRVWQNKINTFWRIGALDFSKLIPESLLNITFNVNRTNGVNYVTYHSLNDSNLFRINVHWDGQVRLHIWNENSAHWLVIWTKPNVCDNGATCGNNGICSKNQSPVCSCLEDFQPKYSSYLGLDDYYGGCVRKNGSQCLKDKDEFVALHNIKQPRDYQSLPIGSAEDCQSACADNCGCMAYSNTSGCYLWYGDLWDMEQLYNTTDGVTIYLRSGLNELPKKGGKNVLLLTLAPSISFLILVLGLLSYYVYRKKIMKGAKDTGQDLLLFDMEMTDQRNRSQVQGNNDLNKGNRDLDLPIFSYSSVLSATDNFSSSNKLGEGGFGPVYKGKLHSGQEVAVKRLSKHSGQGFEELINEAKLIAKLQHTNLVGLLGCCIQQDEKILIYEYMPNKSLDFFLFDLIKKETLDWSTRIHIIEGIAQGLLYLHRYSKLRIIHRDLKASNILLDENMKPKISDFGMARIFGGNQLQANTKHIVGTYGYMPPEYALGGLFSVKTDIFSFGVLVLEILSGERNTTFCHEDSLNLLGYAWKLWTNDTTLELIDPILRTSCDMYTALRYIHVGLLCVQEHPDDRPNISDIIAMIGNEMKVIEVQPKQPAYLATRALEVQLEIYSSNGLTFSTLQPR